MNEATRRIAGIRPRAICLALTLFFSFPET
jgi:hypothetical protein